MPASQGRCGQCGSVASPAARAAPTVGTSRADDWSGAQACGCKAASRRCAAQVVPPPAASAPHHLARHPAAPTLPQADEGCRRVLRGLRGRVGWQHPPAGPNHHQSREAGACRPRRLTLRASAGASRGGLCGPERQFAQCADGAVSNRTTARIPARHLPPLTRTVLLRGGFVFSHGHSLLQELVW